MSISWAVFRKEGVYVYDDFTQLPAIVPEGPPLPFIIAYRNGVDNPAELSPLSSIVCQMSGSRANEESRRAYTMHLAAELKPLIGTIWTHRQDFYALLRSPNQRRYITFVWSDMADHVADCRDFEAKYCSFGDIIHAIVWMAAGGNKHLESWGMKEWLGVNKEERYAAAGRLNTPKSVKPKKFKNTAGRILFDSAVVGSPAEGKASKGKGRPIAPPSPSSSLPNPACSSTTSASPKTSLPSSSTHTPRRAVSLIPQDVLARVSSDKRGLLAHSRALPRLDDSDLASMFSKAVILTTGLPEHVEEYMLAHGYTNDQMTLVEHAVMLQSSSANLIVALGEHGIPLTEASYLARRVLSLE